VQRCLLEVPCVAAVENMSYFEADGKVFHPFGVGSGERIQRDFGLKDLIRFPIVPDLSTTSDSQSTPFRFVRVTGGRLDGRPIVVDKPIDEISKLFFDLAAVVVQEIAKLSKEDKSSASFDQDAGVIQVSLAEEAAFYLDPRVVRDNDTSAKSIEEWTNTTAGRNSAPVKT